jgi:acyl-CoA synthetase (AMP-forming)/AMP-acid ligase II
MAPLPDDAAAEVTSLCAPPTVWRMLIQADLRARPTALREAVGAGEPLNPEVIAHVQKHWGVTIRDGFGQTETTALIGSIPRSPVKPGSMGRPLPGVAVEIVDPVSGRPASDGEIHQLGGGVGHRSATADAILPMPTAILRPTSASGGSNSWSSPDDLRHDPTCRIAHS